MDVSVRPPVLRWPLFAMALFGLAIIPVTSAAAQTITGTTPLAFGSFVAGTGGTVVISTAGARSATGGVTLFVAGPGSASQSTVSGTVGATYSVTLPANGVVSLSDGATHTMPVTAFVSNPSAASASTGLLTSGSQSLFIGATLTIASNQFIGNYTGTFTVTVVYP